MAGDWIKMRGNLWDDPRIARLCDITEASEATIIGGLYWLWSTADQHTEDGFMPGLTFRSIDRKTGIQGFANALQSICWISENNDGIELINFNDHNGQSAKRRCTDAQRKANGRNLSAPEADKNEKEDGQNRQLLGAREEKRREDIKDIAPPEGVDVSVWKSFKAVRKLKKAAITPLAIQAIEREAEKANLSLQAALTICCENNWSGFKATWYEKLKAETGAVQTEKPQYRETQYGREVKHPKQGWIPCLEAA